MTAMSWDMAAFYKVGNIRTQGVRICITRVVCR